MERYTVIGLLPESIAQQLAPLQAFDRGERRELPPHVTIFPPFRTDMPSAAVQTITTWPVGLALTIGRLKSFQGMHGHQIFLDLDQFELSVMRINLRRALCPPLHWRLLFSTVFQITIVDHISPLYFTHVWGTVSDVVRQHQLCSSTFSLSRLHLYRELLSGNWSRVDLSGASAPVP